LFDEHIRIDDSLYKFPEDYKTENRESAIIFFKNPSLETLVQITLIEDLISLSNSNNSKMNFIKRWIANFGIKIIKKMFHDFFNNDDVQEKIKLLGRVLFKEEFKQQQNNNTNFNRKQQNGGEDNKIFILKNITDAWYREFEADIEHNIDCRTYRDMFMTFAVDVYQELDDDYKKTIIEWLNSSQPVKSWWRHLIKGPDEVKLDKGVANFLKIPIIKHIVGVIPLKFLIDPKKIIRSILSDDVNRVDLQVLRVRLNEIDKRINIEVVLYSPLTTPAEKKRIMDKVLKIQDYEK